MFFSKFESIDEPMSATGESRLTASEHGEVKLRRIANPEDTAHGRPPPPLEIAPGTLGEAGRPSFAPNQVT